jgi:hypothetical protein
MRQGRRAGTCRVLTPRLQLQRLTILSARRDLTQADRRAKKSLREGRDGASQACGGRELARRYDLVREELAEKSTSTRRSVPVGARQLFAVIDAEEARGLRRRQCISPAPSPVTASIFNSERRKTALVRNPTSVGERGGEDLSPSRHPANVQGRW